MHSYIHIVISWLQMSMSVLLEITPVLDQGLDVSTHWGASLVRVTPVTMVTGSLVVSLTVELWLFPQTLSWPERRQRVIAMLRFRAPLDSDWLDQERYLAKAMVSGAEYKRFVKVDKYCLATFTEHFSVTVILFRYRWMQWRHAQLWCSRSLRKRGRQFRLLMWTLLLRQWHVMSSHRLRQIAYTITWHCFGVTVDMWCHC